MCPLYCAKTRPKYICFGPSAPPPPGISFSFSTMARNKQSIRSFTIVLSLSPILRCRIDSLRYDFCGKPPPNYGISTAVVCEQHLAERDDVSLRQSAKAPKKRYRAVYIANIVTPPSRLLNLVYKYSSTTRPSCAQRVSIDGERDLQQNVVG